MLKSLCLVGQIFNYLQSTLDILSYSATDVTSKNHTSEALNCTDLRLWNFSFPSVAATDWNTYIVNIFVHISKFYLSYKTVQFNFLLIWLHERSARNISKRENTFSYDQRNHSGHPLPTKFVYKRPNNNNRSFLDFPSPMQQHSSLLTKWWAKQKH